MQNFLIVREYINENKVYRPGNIELSKDEFSMLNTFLTWIRSAKSDGKFEALKVLNTQNGYNELRIVQMKKDCYNLP